MPEPSSAVTESPGALGGRRLASTSVAVTGEPDASSAAPRSTPWSPVCAPLSTTTPPRFGREHPLPADSAGKPTVIRRTTSPTGDTTGPVPAALTPHAALAGLDRVANLGQLLVT